MWSGGVRFNITLFWFSCRVLGKFAFSLSQDWELPIKREVSRWHLSFFHSARGFTYCLPLPALCFSPSSASSEAGSRGCGWGCFPAAAAEAVGQWWQRGLPALPSWSRGKCQAPFPRCSPNQRPLSPCASCAKVGSAGSCSGCQSLSMLRLCPQTQPLLCCPFLGVVH